MRVAFFFVLLLLVSSTSSYGEEFKENVKKVIEKYYYEIKSLEFKGYKKGFTGVKKESSTKNKKLLQYLQKLMREER